jgi:hypothetical protein
MPRKLRPAVDFHQPRFMQISESHCGPAVIQMMLSDWGMDASQEEIAEAGGASRLIEMNGMRVDQLALAVHRLAPHLNFFYKDHATIDELARVVNEYRIPAGVEWQGVFEDSVEKLSNETQSLSQVLDPRSESKTEDEDYGHYSLVIHSDRRRRQLIIVDPYRDYFSKARVFSFTEFDQRWYDFNEVSDPVSGQPALVQDDHLFFIVVRRNVSFPRRLGMRE